MRAEDICLFAEHHRNIKKGDLLPLELGKYGQETMMYMPYWLRSNLACPLHWNQQLHAGFER